MKKMTAALSLLFFALALSACSTPKADGVSIGNGHNGGGGNSGTPTKPTGNEAYLAMQADLTDATGITSNLVAKEGTGNRHLLKVSADGKIKVVLTGEHELISFKLTPNYIVAHVNISEGDNKCSLIAIPRINGMTRVRCLNRDFIHCSRETTGNGGYDTAEDEVYFAYQRAVKTGGGRNSHSCREGSTDDWDSSISELRKWDGKSESVQTLFHSDPATLSGVQPIVRDVFASMANKNVCVHVVNSGILCREEKTEAWSKPHSKRLAISTFSNLIKHGDNLLSDSSASSAPPKLALSTLEVSDRTGALPSRVDFRTKSGYVIGTSWKGTVCVDPKGDSQEVLQGLVEKARPARLGDSAWYFGTSTLRRIELETCTVDPTDYRENAKLLSLTSISWSLGDFLRVDGIGEKGMPSTSLLDSVGKLVTNETVSMPIEHPIELTWK